MSLWDELPADARNSGQFDSLRPLLDGLNGTGPVEETDSDGTWSVYTATENLTGPLALDPRTGAVSSGSGFSGTAIEFRDPNVSVALGFHLTGPGGSRDGGWRVILGAPSVAIRIPILRGAFLDVQGQLRADPAHPTVAFVLPALRIRIQQFAGAAVTVKLLSATTSGPPVDQIYEFVRMEPAYALFGPDEVVGFGFRTAVLDLAGTAGPSGVPATARVMPDEWQGLYLPEVRLFVSPSGVEGLAVSTGARDLWIGIGVHEGVTGLFEAEVVNRGGAPTISVRFHTAAGEYIADPGTGTAQLPEQSTLFVDTGSGLAPVSITIVVNGVSTGSDRVAVTTPASGSILITVTAQDSAAHTTSRSFSAARRTSPAGAGTSGGQVTVQPTQRGSHTIVREAVSPTTVTVRLEPRASVDWTWPGGSSTGETAEAPVATGAPVVVTATFAAAGPHVANCYFLFDHPLPSEGGAYALNEENLNSAPAADRTRPSSGISLHDDMDARRATIGAGTRLTVEGYASYEGDDSTAQRNRNTALSQRRRDAAILVLGDLGYTNVQTGAAHGHAPARDQTAIVADGPTPVPGASGWWLARIYSDPAAAAEVCIAEISRTAPPPAAAMDPTPPAAQRPDCFRKIGVRVEFVRSTFIRGEIYGEFDIETAAESALARGGRPPLRNGPRNPSDGICAFLLRLRLSEDRGAWEVTGEFRALDADLDGLAKMDQAHANQASLDVLGALSIMAPLTSSATELSPAAGAVAALGSVALGASDLIHTHTLILRGGELKVSDGIVGPDGTTTVADRGTQVSVLLDIEVAFSFDLGIVRVDPAHPVTTRYKAIGVRSQWGNEGTTDAPEYVPLPVFDPSRGYTLDVPAGALSASPPLDELLRVLGFRVSRDNPTYLEVEVGLGVDLGIITVDSVRVRGRLDGPPLDLQVTKLVATLDIPGTIHGTGSIEFTDTGFAGAFDLTILPVNIRASAVLAFAKDPVTGVCGVLIGAEVEFPVPILLGNSGLGIYGFLGGIGVNYARMENPASAVPALDWLQAQFNSATHGVMDPSGWAFTPGHYAFAAGMLVGTVDAGFTLHLKGIVIIEVPGPRLLLVMKADVLSLPPVLKSNQSATFLAVLDIDFGRGTITIGIVAAYQIERILKIRVPITAFFDAQAPENWLVDLGSYVDRVTVEVLDVISGSGYLMVHGNGISLPTNPALVVPNGIAVATGFHLQAVLMGSKAAGLYLEVAAGFDAILGLDPFYLAGIIYVRGELRLWIVGISASAELDVQVGEREVGGIIVTEPYVHGEVCGSVDFFFFEVKGCVSLTIGSPTTPTPDPLPLVVGVTLISRSPALVEGTGANAPIEGKLADAIDAAIGGELPIVPLDAIPAIGFRSAPTGDGNIVLGQKAFGSSGVAANPWVRIGDRWWRYELVDVTLTGPLTPAAPTGKTPSTWWKPAAVGGPTAGPTLALLDWLPTPQSVAVPYGEALTNQVTHRWGSICGRAAPPARLLWTFDGQSTGPSSIGWSLSGVAWPDPAGTVRTTPVAALLAVREPWRIDPVTDRMQGTQPAIVIGDAVSCYDGQRTPTDAPLKFWQSGQPLSFSNQTLPSRGSVFAELTVHIAKGGLLRDTLASYQESAWDAEIGDPRHRTKYDCQGRLLRSPERDTPEPAPFGTPLDRETVKQVWSGVGFKPDRLADAVSLTVEDDSFAKLAILLLVPERALKGDLIVSLRNAKGTEIGSTQVTSDNIVRASHPLPADWVDPAGPWADPIVRAGRIAARVATTSHEGVLLALVTLSDLPKNTARVVIGWNRKAAQRVEFPAYYVVAAEGLLRSELFRFDWDTTSIDSDREALSNALTQAADDHALLVPGQTYTLAVTWKAASVDQDAQPAAGTAPSWTANQTQSFQFRAAGDAPTDLSPWILATTPGMNDVGVFCREKVRIALAAQKTAGLFDAYGKELRVLVRAASGHHPEPPGSGSVEAGFTIPVSAVAPFGSVTTTFGVMTPWQQAVQETLVKNGQRCIPSSHTSTDTYTITLDYDFEPLTDYLIDIHAVAKGAPASARGLVYRIGFTTSRFADMADLASYIGPAPVEHRVVPNPAALSALPDRPTGAQVDEAFQAAGLAVPQVPSYPRVQALWTADVTPQPFAVVLESSEPLWRSRKVPTVVAAPPDSPDPSHTYWAARPADWLSVRPSAAPVAAGDLLRAGITRIIRGPGGTRAIAILAAGARGREVRIDLQTAADQLAQTPQATVTATRVSLVRAPWEVED